MSVRWRGGVSMREHLKGVAEIDRLQDFVLVNSYIYYKFDSNVVSDEAFDSCCRMLEGWMNNKEYKKSKHYELFKNFSMATRYTLVEEENKKYMKIAQEIVNNDKYIAY